jgi:hypothetical protein
LHHWRLRLAKHTPQQPQPLLIIQMQHPADGGSESVVIGRCGTLLEPCLPT